MKHYILENYVLLEAMTPKVKAANVHGVALSRALPVRVSRLQLCPRLAWSKQPPRCGDA
jgi:hypothetical protein